jgi:hypothetical protein
MPKAILDKKEKHYDLVELSWSFEKDAKDKDNPG